MGCTLDPSTDELSRSAKMGIDATRPAGGFASSVSLNPLAQAKARRLLQKIRAFPTGTSRNCKLKIAPGDLHNMTPPPLLQVCIRKVDSPHRSKPVLANIELQIRRGEFVLLCGPSESGKSALCRCLAGIIPLYDKSILDGDIVFEGHPLRKLRLPELTGRIGFVQNDPDNQLFCTILEEDLAFGPCSMLLTTEEVNRRVQWAMRFVGLSGFGKRTPLSLSGGEKQRAALASILTLKPAVLIMDRSIDQLDLRGRRNIYRKLRQRCEKDGMSVILVDERLDDIQHLADRIVILQDGSLSYDGAPSQGLNKYFSNSLPKASELDAFDEGFIFKNNGNHSHPGP